MSKTSEWVLKIIAVISFVSLLVLLITDLNYNTLEVVLCAIASLSSLLLIRNKERKH